MKLLITFLTPAFIGKANNAEADFRTPSLKGFMRYWFRTLLRKAGLSWKDIYEEESKIFGSTERASEVKIRVLEKDVRYIKTGEFIGRDYFYLSYIAGIGLAKSGRWQRGAIAPDSKVKLELLPRKKGTEDSVKIAFLSLFIGSYFQGLGARSRKGFGAFEVEVEGENLKLEEAIREFYRSFSLDSGELSLTNYKSFPLKPPLLYNWRNDWRKVLDNLGIWYRGYREQYGKPSKKFKKIIHTGDYDLFIIQINSGQQPRKNRTTPWAPAFGLPVIYNSHFKKFKLTPEHHERRASPIFITFSRDSLWLSYWLDEYLPDGEKVKLEKEEKKESSKDSSTSTRRSSKGKKEWIQIGTPFSYSASEVEARFKDFANFIEKRLLELRRVPDRS